MTKRESTKLGRRLVRKHSEWPTEYTWDYDRWTIANSTAERYTLTHTSTDGTILETTDHATMADAIDHIRYEMEGRIGEPLEYRGGEFYSR